MALGSVNVPGGAATDTVPGLMTPEDKQNIAEALEHSESADKLTTAQTIDGVVFDGTAAVAHFGTCGTAADTAEKVVSVDGFSLVTGAVVFVKFTYYNSADEPTLNVNGTGAKPIVALGQTVSRAKSWPGYSTVAFVYDGYSWVIIGISCEGGTATGILSHTEGYGPVASGDYAHAEGYKNVASGLGSHAEGGGYYNGMDYTNDVSGIASHAEGCGNTVTGDWGAHAEGYNNEVSGTESHAEGCGNTVTGDWGAHAEGYNNEVSGTESHAEGRGNTVNRSYAHAEGYGNTASGDEAHAEGYGNEVSGDSAHAEGYGNEANNIAHHAGGKYGKPSDSTATSVSSNVGDVFTLGNGASNSNRSNCFRVTYSGEVYALAAFNSSGADYSEYIAEWADGNPDGEDRVGYFVTVTPEGLAKAQPGQYIAGITSGNPSVIGNSDEDYYSRYERDSFGRIQWQDVEVTEERDGEQIQVTAHQMVQAADYDGARAYTHRADRAEWDCVGMVGVLPVRDDGTCQVGGFAKCGEGGVATAADSWALGTYYVIERVDDGVVKVIMR